MTRYNLLNDELFWIFDSIHGELVIKKYVHQRDREME